MRYGDDRNDSIHQYYTYNNIAKGPSKALTSDRKYCNRASTPLGKGGQAEFSQISVIKSGGRKDKTWLWSMQSENHSLKKKGKQQ